MREKAEEQKRETTAGFENIRASYRFSKMRGNALINLLYITYIISVYHHFCCHVWEKDYTSYIKQQHNFIA
jgi:hypothetical protein